MESPLFKSIIDINESNIIEDTKTKKCNPINIVYCNKYNYNSPFFFPNPFKSNKNERIFNKIKLDEKMLNHIYPTEEISQSDILRYHTPIYISKLNGTYISKVANMPLSLAIYPQQYIDNYIIDPIRWQCAGTCMAIEKALQDGASINIGGGFNQAKRTRGAYNCILSDIPIAIEKLCSNMNIVIIDLGSRMAEGLQEYALTKDNVYMFDMFNKNNVPYTTMNKKVINADINKFNKKDKVFNVLLDGGYLEHKILGQNKLFNITLDKLDPWSFTEQINNRKVCNHEYMRALKKLSVFLNITKPDLIIYNACYDPYHLDNYGCMDVTKEGIIVRDLYVWKEAIARNIPIAMTVGNSNSPDEFELIGESINEIITYYSKFLKEKELDSYYQRLNNML